MFSQIIQCQLFITRPGIIHYTSSTDDQDTIVIQIYCSTLYKLWQIIQIVLITAVNAYRWTIQIENCFFILYISSITIFLCIPFPPFLHCNLNIGSITCLFYIVLIQFAIIGFRIYQIPCGTIYQFGFCYIVMQSFFFDCFGREQIITLYRFHITKYANRTSFFFEIPAIHIINILFRITNHTPGTQTYNSRSYAEHHSSYRLCKPPAVPQYAFPCIGSFHTEQPSHQTIATDLDLLLFDPVLSTDCTDRWHLRYNLWTLLHYKIQIPKICDQYRNNRADMESNIYIL